MSIGDVEDIFLPLNLLKYKKEEKPWVGYFTNAIIEITIAITERIMCMSLNLNIERLFCLYNASFSLFFYSQKLKA